VQAHNFTSLVDIQLNPRLVYVSNHKNGVYYLKIHKKECLPQNDHRVCSSLVTMADTRWDATLSKGRATALWPWGRPWPSPKGSGQGPANFIRVGRPWPYYFQIYRESIYISIECRPDSCNTQFIHSSFAFLSLQKGQILELYCK